MKKLILMSVLLLGLTGCVGIPMADGYSNYQPAYGGYYEGFGGMDGGGYGRFDDGGFGGGYGGMGEWGYRGGDDGGDDD
ncbi:MAG: hypothetical protein WCD45_07295 [Gallionella sp.]